MNQKIRLGRCVDAAYHEIGEVSICGAVALRDVARPGRLLDITIQYTFKIVGATRTDLTKSVGACHSNCIKLRDE